MRKTILAFAVLSAFAVPALARDAGALRLAPAAAGDQVVQALRTSANAATADLDRTPVAVAWKLDPAEKLDAHPAPFVRESREYWTDVSEAQLRAGVKLPTTAKEALIRLSPHGGNDAALDGASVLVRAGGKQRAATDATTQVADAAALRSAGMDVPGGTVVMKLKADVATGSTEIAAPNARGRYLVHVFEPQSDFVLKLNAERDNIVAGESLRFVATLDGTGKGKLQLVEGAISAPDGHTQQLSFARQADGRFVATVTPDAAHAGGPGLWEVHAFASGTQRGQEALRDAKSAFAVAVPSARFDGALARDDGSDGFALRVGVEVASASRYQVSGVVYGTAADGSLQPAAMAQSAAWLEAGHGNVRLGVDAASLTAAGLRAPYELRDLRLVNQADLSLIERRGVAAKLD